MMHFLLKLFGRRIPSKAEGDRSKPNLGFYVFLDGEHIADLDYMGPNQPCIDYRLVSLTPDNEKIRFALHGILHREVGHTVLKDKNTGRFYTDDCFISNIWEEGIVAIRFIDAPTATPPDSLMSK